MVEAKAPESSASSKWVPANFKTPPNAEMRLMLQSLLAERFGLRVHRESRKDSVYVLAVAKTGAKLKAPSDKTARPFVSAGRNGLVMAEATSQTFTGMNATMDILAARLAESLRRPVLNQTGIQGNFDFHIEYAANDEQSGAAPMLMQAIQDQIGLRLYTQPGSIEILVIDGAMRPSGN